MNIPKEFYKVLLSVAGCEKDIKGTTTPYLAQMRTGKTKGITTTTLSNLAKSNDIKVKLVMEFDVKGKNVKTEIEF